MSTDTPSESITALLAYSQADEEGIIVTVSRQAIHEVVRENARLREEVEMLNVRHAAAMLHAQTHADEYNALREDEKGLLQDIQRLTEEAFKRDEELAGSHRAGELLAGAVTSIREELADANRKIGELVQARDLAVRMATQRTERAEQAEARALAAEKDAGRLRWLLEDHEHPATRELRNSLLNRMQVMSYSAACTDIDAAIAGAKHD